MLGARHCIRSKASLESWNERQLTRFPTPRVRICSRPNSNNHPAALKSWIHRALASRVGTDYNFPPTTRNKAIYAAPNAFVRHGGKNSIYPIHYMEPSILSVVAMPGLKYDHEPADNIWSDREPLRIDTGESKVLDELHIGCQKPIQGTTHRRKEVGYRRKSYVINPLQKRCVCTH